ncbi:bifunctional metallophosphatase/5'-nucleotidase [Comamonas flocculans]|uniref:Bifunctional metallophosphatase/5'-nucleotidase n=1 Tax=Comamonas flocculans TaxID=2597701 RepID=A0A5B8RVS1_9BURK|nr:bifunctional metallophosphatase/5'-nucleotidase [Comamonas flocculans]QEA12335.1 bifunctional metallophosphatase/5'-nucleotidase [Comamonas flocculans]
MPATTRLHGAQRWLLGLAATTALLGLAACGSSSDIVQPERMQITLLGLNDFHGNLQPPGLSVNIAQAGEPAQPVPAGGAAYLASLVAARRAAQPHTAVVAAGDLIGASPLVSSLFLDEPTIEALNLIGLDFASTGNHEYDQGWQELQRMQDGGCAQYTSKTPCQLNPAFAGGQFRYLAANTQTGDGGTLFPPTGVKFFEEGKARIGVGFIGLTLKNTPNMVRPSGVAGLSFTDEADAANAQIAPLRAQGADVIVVLIHQGGSSTQPLQDTSCAGLSGDILPIVQRLSGEVDVVISGHTHQSYLCDYRRIDPARPLLLTSAGLYGTQLTEINLTVDTTRRRVIAHSARQHVVRAARANKDADAATSYPAYPADPAVTSLIDRYAAAAAPLASAPAGRLAATATRELLANGESVLGRITADAVLAATQAPEAGGAQIAFMNSGGVRADLVPASDGTVSYGQVYAVQPFGNTLLSLTLSGAQLQAVLEQQFDSGTNTVQSPRILQVSQGFSYAFDRSQPTGQRISQMQLKGQAIVPTQDYRIGLQNYLATGGDNFSVFAEGRDIVGGGLDVDALADYLRQQSGSAPMALPTQARITALN